jgi:hypothetical protein
VTIVGAAGRAAVALLFASSVHGETAAPPERLQGVDPSAVSPLYAPGGFVPEYTPPAAGTYALPVISTVEDHPLVGSDGKPSTLFAVDFRKENLGRPHLMRFGQEQFYKNQIYAGDAKVVATAR